MALPDLNRRQLLGAVGVGVGGLALSACGGGSLGGDDDNGGGGGSDGPIRVGLVIPQAGVYTPLGVDMEAGWNLWLEQNGGQIGGRDVETRTADEGEGPDTGVPAIQRLIGDVDVVVGIVNSATALGAAELFAEEQKVLLIGNAGAVDLTAEAANDYVWRVSFSNAQNPYAMGEYLAAQNIGSVFIMVPDYAAGQENIVAFTEAFEAGGGTIAGTALTPFGQTQDYQPFLSQIQASGAAATFVFYSGGEAVTFVNQYDSFGLKDTIPLYGSGFLTEGSVLEGQGPSAIGIRTTMQYSTELDNEANQAFVQAYEEANGVLPTVFAMSMFDAANVLNRAVEEAGSVEGDALVEALGNLGEIDDSPRGPWEFEDQNPRQHIYLREVVDEGGTLINAVIEDLGEYGTI